MLAAEELVGFTEELGDLVGEGTVLQQGFEGCGVEGFGAGSGEPVAGLAAEQVVAGFAVFHHVVGQG